MLLYDSFNYNDIIVRFLVNHFVNNRHRKQIVNSKVFSTLEQAVIEVASELSVTIYAIKNPLHIFLNEVFVSGGLVSILFTITQVLTCHKRKRAMSTKSNK